MLLRPNFEKILSQNSQSEIIRLVEYAQEVEGLYEDLWRAIQNNPWITLQIKNQFLPCPPEKFRDE